MTERLPLSTSRNTRSPSLGGTIGSSLLAGRERGVWSRPGRPPPLEHAAAPAGLSLRHRRQLEASVDLLRIAIELESECDFGDTSVAQRSNRVAFLAHFGDWEEALGEWDGAVARARDAPAALWSWMTAFAPRIGLREPPLELGPLIDRLAILTVQRSREGCLAMPQQLLVQPLRSGHGQTTRIVIYVEGQRVGQLLGEEDPRSRHGAYLAGRIQELFDLAQETDEAHELQRAADLLQEAKHALLGRLNLLAASDSIEFADRCPVCRLASTAPPSF
jgi:hypothetical protein